MNKGQLTTLSISLVITVLLVHLVMVVLLKNLNIQSQWFNIIITALASGAFIRFTVRIVDSLLSKSDMILSFILGGYYLRGTWGGVIETASGRKLFFIEKYEQTTMGLVVRGWSFESNKEIEDAWWVTKCANINAVDGQVFFLYETHIPRANDNSSTEEVRYGTGRFNFTERKSVGGAALKMRGRAVDEYKSKGLIYENVFKLSPSMIELNKAKQLLMGKLNT